MNRLSRVVVFSCLLLALPLIFGATSALAAPAALTQLQTVTTVASTVPANGDVNPYGIVRVLATSGKLTAGHILVSNFNSSANLQGTGTTIVDIAPDGTAAVFAQLTAAALPTPCPGGVGLTTALSVLRSGWVIVGSLPTVDGTSATISSGCLIVLNNQGQPVETIFGSLVNGPWDMTAWESGKRARLFVSNVLSSVDPATTSGNQGTVTVVWIPPSHAACGRQCLIASGFRRAPIRQRRSLAPPGWRWERPIHGMTTTVRASLRKPGNRVTVVNDPLHRTTSAGEGATFTQNGTLNGPLGLAFGPQGHLFAVNSNDGFITEINREGAQVASELIDNTPGTGSPGAGTLFGLVFVPGSGIYFVDDGSNTLNLLH
jgi:hypothetical protein